MAFAITGKSAIAAYEITTSTWGTAVAPGASDEIKVEGIGGTGLVETSDMIPDPSAGYDYHNYIEKCKKNVTPELSMPLRWSGRLWSLIAQCFGLDTKTGAGDPYTHLITLLEAIDGSDLFGTLALQLGPAAGELLFEWPSVKPTGFTIEGPDGNGYMHLTVRTIADSVKYGADGTTDATDFDAVTHIALSTVLPGIIPFGVLRFRMNTRSGAALGSGDVIKLSSVNLTFNRGFGQEWNSRGAAANEWETDEPIESGVPEMTLQVGINDLNALTHLENFQDETEQKCDLYWQLTADHNLNIEIPCMKCMNPDVALSGPARIPQTLNFNIMQALANPTGMAFNDMRITLKDGHDTAYE